MDPNENPNEVVGADHPDDGGEVMEPMLHRFGYGRDLQQAELAFDISTRNYMQCLAEYSMSHQMEVDEQRGMADLVLENMRRVEEAREAFLKSGEAILAEVTECLGKMAACHDKVAKLVGEATKAQAEAVRIHATTQELLREIEQAIAKQEAAKNE